MFYGTQGIANKLPRGVKAGALAGSPVHSALPNAIAWFTRQVGLAIHRWIVREAQARAPPMLVGVPRRILVGDAHSNEQ